MELLDDCLKRSHRACHGLVRQVHRGQGSEELLWRMKLQQCHRNTRKKLLRVKWLSMRSRRPQVAVRVRLATVIGWTCGLGMFGNFITIPFSNFVLALLELDIVIPLVPLETMMPVLMGMLGLGAMRSLREKELSTQG